MKNNETVYTKIALGTRSGGTYQRAWLTGTPKQILAELAAKGFEVATKRPSRAKPKAEKKAKPAKKAKAKKAAKKAKAAKPAPAVESALDQAIAA